MFNKIWRFSPEEGTETILAFNIVFTSFLFGDIVPGIGTETTRTSTLVSMSRFGDIVPGMGTETTRLHIHILYYQFGDIVLGMGTETHSGRLRS